MSEVIIGNIFHYDQEFRVVQTDTKTVRVFKYIDLPLDKIELFPLDKPGTKPITGKIEVHIPLWLYEQHKEFFESK